jgi:hypothetical protein
MLVHRSVLCAISLCSNLGLGSSLGLGSRSSDLLDPPSRSGTYMVITCMSSVRVEA